MMDDDAIFGPRPDGGRIAQPPPNVLSEFLDRASKDQVREPHAADMARYRRAVYHVENFESRMHAAEARPTAGEQVFFEALLHTRFFNRSLLLAIGQFKYHLQELVAIDFEGPKRFIESAEITGRKLSKRKVHDVIRMGRLQEMVDERKKLMEKHRTRWGDLTMELLDIALYVLENLVKIDRLCGKAVRFLQHRGLVEKKEQLLVEDIKALLKEQLKDALSYRTVTTADIAQAKQEVLALSRELREGVREDVERMVAVYEAVRGQVKRLAEELDDLLGEFRGNEIDMDQGQVLRFRRLEQSLVLLVANYPDRIEPAGERPGAARSFIVEDKRQDMAAFLADEIRRDPGTHIDRRAKKERRKGRDPNYTGPERRSGKERRR